MDREIQFKLKNVEQAFSAEIRIKVSSLGLGMYECSGCSKNEEDYTAKAIRLVSERVGQSPEHTKYYCLEHAKSSLQQLSTHNFIIEHKESILNTLGGYLKEDVKELEKHLERQSLQVPPASDVKYVDPGSQHKQAEDKPLCLNTDCRKEITADNKSGYMSCDNCKEAVALKLRSGKWSRTTRGGWVRNEEKTKPAEDTPISEEQKMDEELVEVSEDKLKELDEAKKKLQEHILNSNKEGEFKIPLKKVTDEKIIEEVKKQVMKEQGTQTEEQPAIRPATNEEIKEAIGEHNQETVFNKGAIDENLIKGWGLLTEEEKNTLNSKQKWNLREKRKRKMIKDGLLDPNSGKRTAKSEETQTEPVSTSKPEIVVDPVGHKVTGNILVDKPIVETSDKSFKEFIEERSCFHLKEKFWQFFNKKNLPHMEKNSHWFFYINIIKKEKCLCDCLNDIRQARTSTESNGKHNYKQMYSDLKKTKEIDYRSHRQDLLKLAKENRELKVLIQKKINENAKINRALMMVHKKGKDDWQKISKLFLEHKPKGKDIW